MDYSSPERDNGAHEECGSDSSDNSMDMIIPNMTIVISGNSSAVQFGVENILLGEEQMNTENAAISRMTPVLRKISEHHVSVINMTGLHEAEHVDHLTDQLLNESEIQAFIFVVQLGHLTDADKMGLDWLQRVFGDKVLQFVMILFTYETEEESDTIIDDLKRNPVLEQLLEKCGGGFHTCNKMMNNQSEMRDLMDKIECLFHENNLQGYTGEEMRNREHGGGHNTSEMDPNAQLNIILLGKKQVGKSASGNTILGREAFVSKKSCRSVTRDVAVESGAVCGFPVTVYDTPGLFNPDMREEEIQRMINEKVLQECESGPCAFLLVIKEEEDKTVEKIEKLLGPNRLEKTWILFTRGDELEEENITIQEFINETEALKKLVQKYGQRYHVFNNKERGSGDQARLLLVDILQRSLGVKDGGRLTRHVPEDEPDTPVSSLSSTRIVLLGKTGFGKSASGNTILGQEVFESEISSKSVTHGCSLKNATVSGRSVSVVDTPGFFDTEMKQRKLMKEIAKSVYLSSPGPHAFLILFKVNDRFTEHEQQIPQMIEMMFGEEVLRYSIILFTHGDLLKGKTIEQIIEENSRLRHVVQRCGGRYQVLNNRDENNRQQVNDLLQKIDTMIEQNGGGHYSNQMYEDAQRFREEEEKRRLREEEQRKQQEKERQAQIERMREESERIRAEMEVKRSELERLEAERKKDEEERKLQEKERQEIERMINNIEKSLKEIEAERSELERLVEERWRETHEKSSVERQYENLEFTQFYRKHWSRWNMIAFALGHMATGELIGAAIGGAVGCFAGPAGVAAGAAVGAIVGGAVGAVIGKFRLKHEYSICLGDPNTTVQRTGL